MALRKRALIATINADAEIRHRYINDEGQTCVIGGLARVAGVPDSVLRLAEGSFIDIGFRSSAETTVPSDVKAVKTIRRAVSRHFGLTIEQQIHLQMVNDEYLNEARLTRKAKLIALVRRF